MTIGFIDRHYGKRICTLISGVEMGIRPCPGANFNYREYRRSSNHSCDLEFFEIETRQPPDRKPIYLMDKHGDSRECIQIDTVSPDR